MHPAILGKPAKEAWADIWHIVKKFPEQVLSTGVATWEENQLIPIYRNGKTEDVYWTFSHSPIYNKNGIIEGIFVLCMETTQEVLATKRILESEERFKIVANSAPVLIWMSGTDKLCNFFNKTWLKFTGRTIEQEIGNGWIDGVHADDVENCVNSYISSFEKREEFHIEYRLRRNDGEYRWLSDSGAPRFTPDGVFQGYIGACTDIQYQKSFTVELEKLVEDRTIELVLKNKELEKMNKELESFTYISSHDLQEPLRKIQTFSTRILANENQNLTDTGKDHFKRMQNAADRMQRLIQDLLTFSRTSSGERKFELTDLKEVVEQVRTELKESHAEKQVVIETNIHCKINVIPYQFHQLMYNLISNAIKFSKQDTIPHISIHSKIIDPKLVENNKTLPSQILLNDDKYCNITIKDNGIGFNQQYSERIFEVFQRLHGNKEFEGTGIGLAIVKKIVDIHNGFIVANGKENEFAQFDIYLPIN